MYTQLTPGSVDRGSNNPYKANHDITVLAEYGWLYVTH